MNRVLPFFSLFFLVLVVQAQDPEFVEMSYGASYSNQVYYQLEDNSQATVANTSWDIAFTTIEFQDAGIFINEAAALSGTPLELYPAPTNEFSDVFEPMELGDRIHNDELSWTLGAFNNGKILSNPLDYGWGTYNPATMVVEGEKVFVLKLRDGSYKKLMIESLAFTTYTLKHADLDGSNEVTITVDKADFPDSDFAYLSLSTGTTIDMVPDEWDLLFTRYTTPLDDNGEIIQYLLTGTLTNQHISVAQADDVDTETVEIDDYLDDFTSVTDEIGWDWKDLGPGFMFFVVENRAYFVKNTENEVWKIVFIDFIGSSTGEFTFAKTSLGVISSVDDPNSSFETLSLFPNPVAGDQASLAFDLKVSGPATIRVTDVLGQIIWQREVQLQNGFNVQNVPTNALPQGSYQVQINFGSETLTESFIKL